MQSYDLIMLNYCKFLSFIFIVYVVNISSAFAETRAVLVIAGDPDEKKYWKEMRHAVLTTERRFPESSHSVMIGNYADEKDFDWSFVGHGIFSRHSFTEAPDGTKLENAIGEYFENAPKTDDMLILITDHGSAPTKDHPETSSIATGGGPNLSHDKFNRLARNRQLAPDAGYLRIIGGHCYSGALHHGSFVNPKACSITNTWWSKVSYGYSFSYAIFEEISKPLYDINNDGRSSLSEAYLRVIAADAWNSPKQQTSSMAYVDSIFKEGAYEPNVFGRLEFNRDTRRDTFAIRSQLERDYKSLVAAENENCKSIVSVNGVFGTAMQIQKMLYSFDEQHPLLLSDAEKDKLPKELQDFYNNFIKSPTIRSIIAESDNDKMSQLRKEWDEIGFAKVTACGVVNLAVKTSNCQLLESKSEKLRDKILETIENRRENNPKSLGDFYPVFMYLKKAARLMEQGTPDQKETFQRLVKCETSPL